MKPLLADINGTFWALTDSLVRLHFYDYSLPPTRPQMYPWLPLPKRLDLVPSLYEYRSRCSNIFFLRLFGFLLLPSYLVYYERYKAQHIRDSRLLDISLVVCLFVSFSLVYMCSDPSWIITWLSLIQTANKICHEHRSMRGFLFFFVSYWFCHAFLTESDMYNG